MNAFKALLARATHRPWGENEIKAQAQLRNIAESHVEELVGALTRTIKQFKACAIRSGTDEEFAEAAVADARALLARIEEEAGK